MATHLTARMRVDTCGQYRARDEVVDALAEGARIAAYCWTTIYSLPKPKPDNSLALRDTIPKDATFVRNKLTMKKIELKSYLLSADAAGTLVTAKHDPANLTISWPSYRTVLTPEAVSNIHRMLELGAYDAHEYENLQQPLAPYYIEVVSKLPEISVPASGVQRGAIQPDRPMDRFLFYSGTKQGWHCCGANSATIQQKLANGEIRSVGPVTD